MENEKSQVSLAFLVDGDNASASLIKEMLTEVSTFGPILIRNVYGDWSSSSMKGWREARLEHALQPIQQFANVSGKNATDIALIIDAMDILHEGIVNGFCIVSSDSDFTTLALRLRKSGALVIGIGEAKTHVSFRNACDRFIITENLEGQGGQNKEKQISDLDKKTKDRSSSAKRKSPKEALELIKTAYDSIELDGNYAYLSQLGMTLNKLDPSFDPRSYGKRRLSDLLFSLSDHFEITKDAEGQGGDIIRKK